MHNKANPSGDIQGARGRGRYLQRVLYGARSVLERIQEER